MKKMEAEQAEAVFPERLNAGKSLPLNGGLGMYSTPHYVPEVLRGAVVSSSI